jgi:hypothetical protein
MSDGLYDSPEIWFSANHIAATIFTFKSLLSNSFIVAYTHAAPHISHFISCILFPGFTCIQPVSKVTHFPTKPIVGNFLSTILSKITICGL